MVRVIKSRRLKRVNVTVLSRGLNSVEIVWIVDKSPTAGLRIRGQIIGKKFQGDEAAEIGVVRFVDDTHPATAK
jgi:hypothetical protein